MKNLLRLLVVLAATHGAFAADLSSVTGLWQSKNPNQKLTLKATDGKLTGTLQSLLGTVRLSEAKLEGDKITLTFFVVLNNGNDPLGLAGYDAAAEQGQVSSITYSGSLAGEDLKIAVVQENLGKVREITFHKGS